MSISVHWLAWPWSLLAVLSIATTVVAIVVVWTSADRVVAEAEPDAKGPSARLK